MPEIGETLREARMRRRIDMTEVESATKIRAKYLRALENEEWDLLPGPTFVKSFLRTYSEYLELDSRMLVEEYRQRFERPSTQDLTAFTTGIGRAGRRRRARVAGIGPRVVTVLGVAVLLGALYLLGSWGEEDDPGAGSSRTEQPAPPARERSEEPEEPRERREERRPRRVRLQLRATGAVYVCLVDARGRQVIDEETLSPGTRTRTFTSRSFRTNFGNNNVRMRVNGRTYRVAASSDPIGYELRPGRRPRRLPDAARPDCSS
ncbi:MAG: helix-turn-helix domain-containing protein [Solirubrobacteraceae bacterium]